MVKCSRNFRMWLMLVGLLVMVALVLGGCGVRSKPLPANEQATSSGGQEATSGEQEASAVNLPPAPPIEKVKPLIQKGACGSCHAIPGIEGANGQVGPSWCDVAQEVQEGKEDVAFIRESIVDPDKEIASGYQAGIMPKNFGQMFSEEELNTLVAFIANLKCK